VRSRAGLVFPASKIAAGHSQVHRRGHLERGHSHDRVGRRSHEQKINGSSHQELPANGRVLKRSRRVLAAGCPLRARRRKRTRRLRARKRPANAGLLTNGWRDSNPRPSAWQAGLDAAV